jgi:hypothetical protein
VCGFQFIIQLGATGAVFFFGNIAVRSHIHQIGDSSLYAGDFRFGRRMVNGNRLVGGIILPEHLAGKLNCRFPFRPQRF